MNLARQAVNANSEKLLRNAISCAPRAERANWMLHVQVLVVQLVVRWVSGGGRQHHGAVTIFLVVRILSLVVIGSARYGSDLASGGDNHWKVVIFAGGERSQASRFGSRDPSGQRGCCGACVCDACAKTKSGAGGRAPCTEADPGAERALIPEKRRPHGSSVTCVKTSWGKGRTRKGLI